MARFRCTVSIVTSLAVIGYAKALIVGNVTTVAGSTTGFADGIGSASMFNNPSKAELSPDGSFLLVVSRRRSAAVQKYRYMQDLGAPA